MNDLIETPDAVRRQVPPDERGDAGAVRLERRDPAAAGVSRGPFTVVPDGAA